MYVAAESYKFARVYPLNQRDIPESTRGFVNRPLASLPSDIPVRSLSSMVHRVSMVLLLTLVHSATSSRTPTATTPHRPTSRCYSPTLAY